MAKFQVQARVVDLLGTQQIANCPTAISELFKNAYDAYARKAILDVAPEDGYAILWDDGVGMTEEEVLSRWLVVGAAGKEELDRSTAPPDGMKPRAIQGEKGIGRLAISTLGDTLLLISRSIRPPSKADPYVALLINWNLIRNENLLLSDIEVPTITFSALEELESGIIADMVEGLRGVVRETEAAWKGAKGLRQKLLRQLDSFQLDLDSLRHVVDLQGGRGTLFFISGLVEEFRVYVEPPGRNDDRELHPNVQLVQLLSNFRKTFEGRSEVSRRECDFQADVRRLDPETHHWRSFFDEKAAVEIDDLRSYDHYIDVRFDEVGRYEGTFKIYGEEVELPAPDRQIERSITCGPFRLRLWYFHGRADESSLGREEWEAIGKKLTLFGGLMIYRDNLRVLPYGNPEFDWLRFEERRSKSASRYFFSYRRMFGYVDISRSKNPKLIDKAGREGLIHNAAYRDLRATLINFFSELALRHFQKAGSFALKKGALKERAEQLKAEEERVDRQRKHWRDVIGRKIQFLAENREEALQQFLEESLVKLRQVGEPDAGDVAEALKTFQDELARRASQARVTIPVDLPLGKDRELLRLVHDHGAALEAFSQDVRQTQRKFQDAVRKSWPKAERTVDRPQILHNARSAALSKLSQAYQEIAASIARKQKEIRRLLEKAYEEQCDLVERSLLSATSSTSVEEAKRSQAGELAEVIGALNSASAEAVESLAAKGHGLEKYLTSYIDGEPDKLRRFQFDEIEELREQVNRNLDLVQLGLSVEIIDHDLERLYRGIRANLARLRNMVRNAPKARQVTEELRASFQHLEQRYKLMSPLYRGSYRIKERIDGKRILTYCRAFLDNPLHSVGVILEGTEAFCCYVIHEVPAVVLPVFVNIIDNSIYWLRDVPEPRRRVVLDRIGDVVTVCDSGPGIHPTLFDEIFEPFVSTKPSGRGLGLYIARANLTRYHHEIWATADPLYRKLPGACFCIRFHEDAVVVED